VIYLSDAEQAVRPGSIAGAVLCSFSPTVDNYGLAGFLRIITKSKDLSASDTDASSLGILPRSG
jgi:hypothetical protein